jgi:hypothetical protein
MKGKIVVITIASVVIYLLLVATFFFATPFLASWGEAKPWYLQVIIFAQDFPFNLMRDDGEIKMSLIFINALIWTLLIATVFYFMARLINNKSEV